MEAVGIKEKEMCEIYVRQAVEAGLADSKAGRATDVLLVRQKFGLSNK